MLWPNVKKEAGLDTQRVKRPASILEGQQAPTSASQVRVLSVLPELARADRPPRGAGRRAQAAHRPRFEPRARAGQAQAPAPKDQKRKA